MKKSLISPVASLLVSLCFALGILVSDLNGFRLLTTAHAQTGACGGMVVGQGVSLEEGVAVSGIAVRDIYVNGQPVSEAVIAGQVQLVGGNVVSALGVIVGGNGGDGTEGVIVGGYEGTEEHPCGVIVGGNGGDGTEGVIVGGREGDISLTGATLSASGTAVGGSLTGDGITVVNGVITGQNLLLSGTTIEGGSISGVTEGISVPPSN